MGRKPSENHNISVAEEENVAEALIKQQNAGEEFVLGEDEVAEPQPEPEKPKPQPEPGELQPEPGEPKLPQPEQQRSVAKNEGGVVILTRAATYFDCGIRFLKNKPVQVSDERVYEHLLNTGLFVHL